MFNSVVISIAITLVFIFLLLSLMVTAVNDIIFTVLRSKSKQLEKYLDELFFNDEQWKFIFSKIKNSPFINVLKKAPNKFPSTIPAENFSTALLAHIGNNDLTIEALKKAVASNKEKESGESKKSEFFAILEALLSQNPTYEQLRVEIDKIFNNAMDRLSGWYKRKAKLMSFMFAFLICAGFNVDTISISQNLWNNKDKAEQIASFAAAASSYFERNDSSQVILKSGVDTLAYLKVENSTLTNSKAGELIAGMDTTNNVPVQQLQKSYNILASLDIPMGWNKQNIPQKTMDGKIDFGLWLLKIIGLLLTTAAVSLGAPYWFDILNKITPLKQSAIKPGGSTPPVQNSAGAPIMPAINNNAEPVG